TDDLPTQVKQFLPIMIAEDWLGRYLTFSGLALSLKGIDRRTQFKSAVAGAVIHLKMYYHEFEEEFRFFFPSLMAFAKDFLKE
ncbi:MAG: acyl carrier protein phosphodiesterase, partial [Flammeovirgaceae bacterium]|nr:acyl carrier protein phosphodiesterase [Flammeovirgaceae bacterium]MDW8287242.1 ACP phosphodiesterase [Flammeovirgaceae bacterium]